MTGSDSTLDTGTLATVPTASSTQPADTTAPPPVSTVALAPGRLRVAQEHTGVFYTEGSISYLVVRDSAGVIVVEREFAAPDDVVPVADVELPPGSYEVESYQRPCDGNCDLLDAPTDRCVSVADVVSGEQTYVTATYSPGEYCSITRTDVPAESLVPDAYALRDPDVVCDMAFWDYMSPSVIPPGKQCLIDANREGVFAELQATEPLELAIGTDAVPSTLPTQAMTEWRIYRSNPNRTVDVFVPVHTAGDVTPWTQFRCAGLKPDARVGFLVTDCERVTNTPSGSS